MVLTGCGTHGLSRLIQEVWLRVGLGELLNVILIPGRYVRLIMGPNVRSIRVADDYMRVVPRHHLLAVPLNLEQMVLQHVLRMLAFELLPFIPRDQAGIDSSSSASAVADLMAP